MRLVDGCDTTTTPESEELSFSKDLEGPGMMGRDVTVQCVLRTRSPSMIVGKML